MNTEILWRVKDRNPSIVFHVVLHSQSGDYTLIAVCHKPACLWFVSRLFCRIEVVCFPSGAKYAANPFETITASGEAADFFSASRKSQCDVNASDLILAFGEA